MASMACSTTAARAVELNSRATRAASGSRAAVPASRAAARGSNNGAARALRALSRRQRTPSSTSAITTAGMRVSEGKVTFGWGKSDGANDGGFSKVPRGMGGGNGFFEDVSAQASLALRSSPLALAALAPLFQVADGRAEHWYSPDRLPIVYPVYPYTPAAPSSLACHSAPYCHRAPFPPKTLPLVSQLVPRSCSSSELHENW